jgi:6-phosphofructokinase 2
MVIEAGGGGINVSKAIRKLSGESLTIFPSGGINGTILENYLGKMEIQYKTIAINQETRENLTVMETGSNTQYRFVMPGASVSEKVAPRCFEIIRNLNPKATIIVGSGSLPPGVPENFYADLAVLSRQLGAKFIVDTSGDPLKLAADAGVYMLKPNLSELSTLVGKEHLELNEVDDAAMEIIRKKNCEVMVVSLGPSGALLVTRAGYEHVPSPSVKKKSTVGAGDSMVAGMVWMLSAGKSLKEMVRFGVACGTAATMNAGTQLFRVDDVQKLYSWINKYADQSKLNFEN